MPSVRNKPTRSSTLNTLRSKTGLRKPVRKALIIGISYKNSQDSKVKELRTPHKDATDWRNLMIDKYKFAEEDITMMLDDENTPPHLLPTRENIIQEIKALVDGAQSKDRFMFYFAGHSKQFLSTDYQEIDGFDEAIITYSPSGLNHPTILDDILKDLLVDPLPVDAYLTAIFDSCHSGTLLDLEHYTCNSVWFPWCNRGPRRLQRSRWPGVLRRDGYDPEHGGEQIKVDLALAEAASDAGTGEDTEETPTPTPTAPAEKPSVRIYERTRNDDDRVVKRNFIVDDVTPHEREQRRFVITRSSTLEVPRRDSFLDARKPRRWLSFHNFDLMTTLVDGIKDAAESAAAAFGFPRCASPVSILPCDGWCKPGTRKSKAQVISISACQDPQRTWESRDGWTMTQSMIAVLEVNPHPPVHDLIKTVGHDLHKKTTLKLHTWSGKQLAKWNKLGQRDALPDVEIVNGAEPSLGSSEPLRKDAIFHP